ncbi:MAG: AsmA-like C-terminal region-containing protein [Bacteroidia bacterium]
MSKFKKILLFASGSLAVLIGIALLLAWIYGPEIKQKVVQKANEQLQVEVQVEDISFSFLSNFPYASVTFKDVQMRESFPGSEQNLAEVKSISLLFNIFNIFSDNLQVEKIVVEDAIVFLRIDENGRTNFEIFKEDDQSTAETDTVFSLDLKEILLVNVDLRFEDLSGGQKFRFVVDDAQLSGEFTADVFDLEFDGDLYADYFQIDSMRFVKDKRLKLAGILAVESAEKIYKIKEAELELGGSKFMVHGYVQQQGEDYYSDLEIEGRETDVKSLLALIPDEYLTSLEDYESSGRIYFEAQIKGIFTGSENPAINFDFGIEDATIRNKEKGIALENVYLKGNYNNGESRMLASSVVDLSGIKATLKGKEIQGDFFLRNFDTPFIKTHLITNINLEDLHSFLHIKGIEEMRGNLYLDASFSGDTRNLKDVSSIHKTSLSGKAVIGDVNIIPENTHLEFRNLNGRFFFDKKDMVIENFSGRISESDFTLNGFFRNFASFLFLPDKKLVVDADLQSQRINLNELLKQEVSEDETDTTYSFSFPEYLQINFGVALDQIVFHKFEAQEVRGRFNFNEGVMRTNGLSFITMNGKMNVNGKVSEKDKKFYVDAEADCTDLDIKKLFYAFGNFGQEYLMDKHLKGKLTADISLEAVYNNDFSPEYDKLNVVSNMVVRDGELINFEPVTEMAGFIKMKKMEHLKFDELRNEVLITRQVITLPQMTINNNAMTMKVSGTHNFENEFNYKIDINLSELLFGKNDLGAESYRETESDGRGGMHLYLLMYGDDDNYFFKYDKKEVKQRIAEGIKEEGRELKNLFKKKKDEAPPQETKRTPDPAGEEYAIDPVNPGTNSRNGREESEKKEESKSAFKRLFEKPKEE